MTVEDCLKKVNNRFALVKLAVKRTKQLMEGAPALVKSDNKEIIVSLREIAKGKVAMAAPAAKKSSKKAAHYTMVKLDEERP